MPAPNFMLQDLFGALTAIAILPVFLLLPGYAVAWVLDIFEFRRRTTAFRFAFAIPLSIAVCPILTYLLARFGSMILAQAMYGATAVISLILMFRARRDSTTAPERRAFHLKIAAILAIWLAVCLLSLIDLQIGHRLYYSTSTLDYSVRTAFVHSITTTGVPPQSPFFQPGHPVLLRYHYFWVMMCSLADQAKGPLLNVMSARHAVIGGTFWAGTGLIALLAVYLRLFATGSGRPLNRRLLLGVALLAITGLDIIPALFFLFLHARNLVTFVLPSVELWNEHVDWFLSTTISTPHAIAATIACFTGFLLLWHADGARRYVPLAALAFASATGESLYVAFSFAIFLAIWVVIGLAKGWYRQTAMVCMAGAASALLLLPYLRDLAGPGGGGPLFHFTVREFSLAALVPTGTLPAIWRRILVNGSLLPLNYLLEFGLFFLVGRYRWLQHRASGQPVSRPELAMTVMVVTSTLLCTFLKSSVIGNNDLGWRGFLMAQFVLLLWAVDLLGERDHLTFLNAAQKQLLAVFFALGFAGTVTDLALIRFYPLLADGGVVPPLDWMSPDRDFGRRTYAERAAYEWLRSATPANAHVQANPNVVAQDVAGTAYGDRPTVAGDLTCHTVFGGDPAQCKPVVAHVRSMYPVDGASTAASFQEGCRSVPVDTFVAKDTDPVWNNRQSWVWTEPPAYANAYMRLFRCQSPTPALTSSR